MTKSVPLESTITKNILKYLNGLPRCYARKIPGTAYGGGWPDIFCARNGIPMFFEVKRPKPMYREPTELQKSEMQRWREAGVPCFVVTSVDSVREIMGF